LSTELGQLDEVGTVASELGKGLAAMKQAFENGESLSAHIESVANWLEDRAMEGIDQLQAALEWVDGKLDTELASMTDGLRTLVTEVFGTTRELVAMGEQFVNEHPEVVRGLATLVAALVGPEFGPIAEPLLRQAGADLAELV
jgi:ElaB/YqjD/DUF883 family membrane-anchored ribosome-binding protein